MRYGTYTTFDAPTKDEDKALEWLKEQFEKINARVYRKMNSHDFGMYPSFEIDYPNEIEDLTLIDEDERGEKDWEKIDNFHDRANEIEKEYCDKFMQD